MNETTVAVADAGPIIHLDQLESLELLEGFDAVLIPQTVWQEAQRHRPALTVDGVPRGRIVPDLKNETMEIANVSRAFDLHTGERHALELLNTLQNALLLSDDAAARFAAKMLGFRVHGTIGLLIRAIRRGSRSATRVRETLAALPRRCTLHVKRELLEGVIASLPEA